MKNTIIATLLMLLCHGQSSAQKTVTIKGTVNGDLQGHQQIYVYGKGIKSDTAIISNGQFELTLPFTQPFVPLFYDEYDVKIKKGISPYPVIIDRPGVVYLKDINIEKGLSSGKVSGIKSAEEFQEFNTQQASKSEKEALALEHFIKQHPDSYTGLYLLGRMRSSLSAPELERIYQLLSKNVKQLEEGRSITDYLNGLKNSAIGQTVKNFTLNTPEEKLLDFSVLKGKYVIIDFWASWCGPCKASFPHMKEIYKKYKSDKFEIYSISIDQSKSAWLNELKKQDLPWLQSLDTKSIATSSFAVSAVPTTFMIDPQGKILMKEIGFDSSGNGPLEKKLIEIFGAR
jgi:thiol-disulfide isomerase/thioredoxin